MPFRYKLFSFFHMLYIWALGMGLVFLHFLHSSFFPLCFLNQHTYEHDCLYLQQRVIYYCSYAYLFFVLFVALKYGFYEKIPEHVNCFWSVIISKRNTGHKAMKLSKEQRRILKLKNSHLYTKLLQNIYSAMYIQKLSPAFPPLLLLKEFLTSLGLTATKTKPLCTL